MSTRLLSPRFLLGWGALFLVVLALAIGGLTRWLRVGLRGQVLRREGVALQAVTEMQRAIERERLGGAGLREADEELALIALQTARLNGVLGVQVFDVAGHPLTQGLAPFPVAEPKAEDWAWLAWRRPVVLFRSDFAWDGEGRGTKEARFPVLDILVPLHDADGETLTGAARFILDGEALAEEFALMDLRLLVQGFVVWAGTALLMLGGSLLALARLRRAHAALEARTRELAQANRELTFAAKTSALGAVAAHLVHGLRNPIAGLEQLMQEGASADSVTAGAAAARRMRDMVNEVVTLLHEERAGVRYELSAAELLESVAARVRPLAESRSVALHVQIEPGERPIDNRTAGLAAAILVNLARNACEAAPERTGEIRLHARPGATGAWEFSVRDNGPGLAPALMESLFEPVRSSKSGGAGIGLAICRQLAVHLGARLELLPASTGGGAEFRLCLAAETPQSS